MDTSCEQLWSYETEVEFDSNHVDDAIVLHGQDLCRCCLSRGDVIVRPPHGVPFSFSFSMQGYNRDFLLFSGLPGDNSEFFANFVCWHPKCIVLPQMTTYHVTAQNGFLSFSVAAQVPKVDPKSRPTSKKPKLALPKNSCAMAQLPEAMAAHVKKPRIRLTADFITFRLWSGASLTLNPCQLPADDTVRKDWIRLNVGGILFDTTRHALLKEPDTFFEALLASGAWEPNQKGQYEIDRSPTYFPHILTYLTSGKLDIWNLTVDQIKELQHEMDYYSITSLGKGGSICFEMGVNDVASLRLSLSRTTVKCTLFTGDVRLILPPGIQSSSLLLSFTVTGSNTDFMLYSGDDFSQDLFFANFYIAHPNVIPIPALHRYVIKIAQGQVSFVRIGNPPADEKPSPYAIKVTKPISDVTMPLKGERLYFRLWAGVQIDLVNV